MCSNCCDVIFVRQLLRKKGSTFGVGVSDGEEGALNGPALMPSGDIEAYQQVAPILEKIAAQVDGKPCCSYLGKEGPGHYVKMVHYGIEYADMQLITEAHQFLREKLGLDVNEIAAVFEEWNKGELESYLMEITADILTRVDEETNQPMEFSYGMVKQNCFRILGIVYPKNMLSLQGAVLFT